MRSLKNLKNQSNYKVLNIDSSLMFYCEKKKFDWYLKSDLAELINENTAKITFTPKGPGELDPNCLLKKKLICVCCGVNYNLTRHHVVPHSYRKHFPATYKNHKAFDVVYLCLDCHKEYENFSNELRKQIHKRYNVEDKLVGLVKSFKNQEKPDIKEKILEKIKKIDSSLNTEEKVLNFEKQSFCVIISSCEEQTVSKLESIEEFIVLWRSHFLDYAKPKYIGDTWKERSNHVYIK